MSLLARTAPSDQTATSTITAPEYIPTAPNSDCYALKTLSRWLDSIKKRTKMDLMSKFHPICSDLRYQWLLNMMPNVRKPMTMLFCKICDALQQNVVSIGRDELHGTDAAYAGLLCKQIRLSMHCLKILITYDGLHQEDSTMNPKPKYLISLLHSVYDLPSTHPVRYAALEQVYKGVLSWLNGYPTFPRGYQVPRGLITIQCYHKMNRVTFLCREEIFVDLLFRGASAFALQFGVSHTETIKLEGLGRLRYNPSRFRSLSQEIIMKYQERFGVEHLIDDAILPLCAPVVMFPYLTRAKQNMICLLENSDCVGINAPGIADIVVSYLFIEGKEQFFGKFDQTISEIGLCEPYQSAKVWEFVNWIRMMGAASRDDPLSAVSRKSVVAQEQFEYFQETDFAQNLVKCRKSMSMCVMFTRNYGAPDLKYVNQLIRIQPPPLWIYQKIVFDAVDTFAVCDEKTEFHRDIIDWLQHMEIVYPKHFDINFDVTTGFGTSQNLLTFTMYSLLEAWNSQRFNPNPDTIKLILYLLNQTKSYLDFDEANDEFFSILFDFCVHFGLFGSMEMLSIILQAASVEPSVMRFNCSGFDMFFENPGNQNSVEDGWEKLMGAVDEYLKRGSGQNQELDEIITKTRKNMNEWESEIRFSLG